MYSDEENLSGSNEMGVLYLAQKYMVPSLAEKCTKHLQDNLGPSNVFSILPSAQKYGEKRFGGPMLGGIFPTKKQEEFASLVLDSDILTKEEVFSIIKHLSSVSSSPMGLLETKRCGLQFDAEIQEVADLAHCLPFFGYIKTTQTH